MSANNHHAIARLTPAAARLLLSLLASQPQETYDDAVMRAGICEYATMMKARDQLRDHGFLMFDAAGREYLDFYPASPEAEPTDSRSRITKAEGWR